MLIHCDQLGGVTNLCAHCKHMYPIKLEHALNDKSLFCGDTFDEVIDLCWFLDVFVDGEYEECESHWVEYRGGE